MASRSSDADNDDDGSSKTPSLPRNPRCDSWGTNTTCLNHGVVALGVAVVIVAVQSSSLCRLPIERHQFETYYHRVIRLQTERHHQEDGE